MVTSPNRLETEKVCALARTSSIYTRQTRHLVREGVPKNKIVTVKNQYISDHEPQMGLDTKTYRLIDSQSQCDFDFERQIACARRMRRRKGIQVPGDL
jgi:hypothetical protein